MKFSEAFKLMKQGAKVKLPGWGGFWYWDAEKETIMIQCRPQDSDTQGDLLDKIGRASCRERVFRAV